MGLNMRIISYYKQLNGVKLLRERLAVIGGKLSTLRPNCFELLPNPTLQECGDIVYWGNPIPASTWEYCNYDPL